MSRIALKFFSCLLLLAVAGGGCDSRSSTSSSGAGSSRSSGSNPTDADVEISDDPVAMAKEVDKYAAEELAQSKFDARQWLAGKNNTTWEAKKSDIVKLVNDLIAAG